MANNVPTKKGLTTFGWLAIGATALAVLSNKDRRERVLKSVRDLGGKFSAGAADGASSSAGAAA